MSKNKKNQTSKIEQAATATASATTASKPTKGSKGSKGSTKAIVEAVITAAAATGKDAIEKAAIVLAVIDASYLMLPGRLATKQSLYLAITDLILDKYGVVNGDYCAQLFVDAGGHIKDVKHYDASKEQRSLANVIQEVKTAYKAVRTAKHESKIRKQAAFPGAVIAAGKLYDAALKAGRIPEPPKASK